MIEIRKLAAIDMAWLGPQLIVTEYALGVILPMILGLLSLRSSLRGFPAPVGWEVVMGCWLVSISLNYIPLLIYALLIAKAGRAQEEGRPEFTQAKRYGIQQVIILIPFLVIVVALMQEVRRHEKA